MSIILGKDFDPSNISYSDVKLVGKQGAKIVYVSLNGNPIILQTPEMSCPFGMSSYNAEQKGAADKYSIGLSFKGKEFNTSMQKFFDNLLAFDDKNLDSGLENSLQWFKTKHNNREVVRALYTPTVKFAKDKTTMEITDKYPPTIRLSLPYRDGKIAVDCYDDNRQPLELNDSLDLKGARITAIIQCTGIWLVGGKFIPSWKAVQLKVKQNATTIKGFAFKDDENDSGVALGDDNAEDDGENDDECESDAPVKPSVSTKSAPSPKEQEYIPESDEEEDELEKPKVVKKSLVIKKKATGA